MPAASTGPPGPSADELHREAAVRAELVRAAGARGVLAFDRFMEIALYSEGIGFYTRPESPFGRTGDFYTAPQVHPLFAATLGGHVAELLRQSPGPQTIVEIGPGDGRLAEGVVRAIAVERHDLADLRYVLVERSSNRAREALERVRRAAPALRVEVAPSLACVGPVRGVVLANELMDALPSQRWRFDGTIWREEGVRTGAERLTFADLGRVRTPGGSPLPIGGEDGGILELPIAAEAFVREVADHLVEGRAILIDYGMEEDELLRAHPGGTLSAVRRHRFEASGLDHPGLDDLSTFLNLTRLRSAAKTAGLRERAFGRQAEVLGSWGLPARLERAVAAAPDAVEALRVRLGTKNLLFGFERFWVWELGPTGERG